MEETHACAGIYTFLLRAAANYTEERMFFRREQAKTATVAGRIDSLRSAGFTVSTPSGGVYRVTRGNCAVDLREDGDTLRTAGLAGIVMGSEIGSLVDGGFQKFFRTPSGHKKPAVADELKAVHDFEEDFKEAVGLKSLYNESLGTVSTFYLYDRVKDRDKGVPKRIWEQ